jgi:predicted GNAT family N-acyltransferase
MSIETGYQPSEKELGIEDEAEKEGEVSERFQLTEEQRQKALQKLERLGYFNYDDNGRIVADLEKFDTYSTVRSNIFQKLIGASGYYVLQHIFHNLPVISSEDYGRGVREPKPLFYDPASDEEALNIQAIKEADYYLNPVKGSRKIQYPGLEKVNKYEANLALLTYSTDFGDGFRDNKTGKLMVRDKQDPKQRYKPIRFDYFLNNYSYDPISNDRKGPGFSGSPNKFLTEKGKNLVESGLLTTDDFHTMHRTGEALAQMTEKTIGHNGTVFFDGIRYHVGKNLRGSETKVLNDGTVLVVSGLEEKITHYFKLRPELRDGNKRFTSLNAPETNLQPFNRQDYMLQDEDESDENYQKRIEALRAFELKPIRTEDLSPKTKARMKNISRQNWSQIDNPELGAQISNDFAKILDENKPTRWYLAQANDELLGFIRFDDISDTEVYAGSLNVDDQSRGAQIGESILKSCLIKESQSKVVKGTAYPKLPIAAKYLTPQTVGGYGFVATGLTYYEGTEVPFFQMEIDQKKNTAYQAGQMKIEDIAGQYRNNQYQEKDNLIVLRYNPVQENDQIMIACNALLTGNKVMTGFMADPQDKNYRYLVFENSIASQEETLEDDLMEAA